VFDEMKELAYRTCGEEIAFLTGFGATETAPATLARVWSSPNAANMGLPPPGAELKLVPMEGRYEMRVKGPHVTPGYWRAPQLTERAFDAEGYYCIGDTFLFDRGEPANGLLFAGRIAEDFKLLTGTWVHVGELRARFIQHFAPLVRDVVFAGEGRSDIGALIFLSGPASREELRRRLSTLENSGSSNRITRALVLEEPPSLDAGEATDKGSINQRAVLARRKQLVEELFSDSERVLRT
jgi:feruloyl-CoA synthase